MTTYAQVCREGHILNHSTNPEYIAGENNYCKECGSGAITECQKCKEQNIIVSQDVLASEDSVTAADLPLYCGQCGEAFPWSGAEDVSQNKRGQFVDINITENKKYKKQLKEINRVYKIGADSATLVLARKVVESCIIDVLLNEYGKERSDLFFNSNKNQHHNFSVLKENFKNKKDDFKKYNEGVNHTLFERIDELRQSGNIEAHHIMTMRKIEEMEEYSEYLGHVLICLFGIMKSQE
ncbi:MAG: DUF2321 domain-containing protein [Candidatus Paceibacteria bacterium]